MEESFQRHINHTNRRSICTLPFIHQIFKNLFLIRKFFFFHQISKVLLSTVFLLIPISLGSTVLFVFLVFSLILKTRKESALTAVRKCMSRLPVKPCCAIFHSVVPIPALNFPASACIASIATIHMPGLFRLKQLTTRSQKAFCTTLKIFWAQAISLSKLWLNWLAWMPIRLLQLIRHDLTESMLIKSKKIKKCPKSRIPMPNVWPLMNFSSIMVISSLPISSILKLVMFYGLHEVKRNR